MRRIVLDTNCLLMCVSSKSPYHKVWTEFVEAGFFKKDYTRPGLPIRKLLRELDDSNELHLTQ